VRAVVYAPRPASAAPPRPINDSRALHTSYALQSGYEPLIRQVGTASGRDIEQIRQRHTLTTDSRDLLAARNSLKQFLGLSQLDT
jgi:hypothetical protein